MRVLPLERDAVTWSAHSPTLQIEIVRSARQQALTPPKHSEPVTASLPAGASPLHLHLVRARGSFVVTVIVRRLGAELRRREADRHGQRVARCDQERVGERLRDDEVGATTRLMPDTVSGQWPLLFRISGSSANEPTQTLPKSPRSAMHEAQPRRARLAGNVNLVRPGRVVAEDGDRCGLGADARRLEPDRHFDRVAGAELDRIGDHARRLEVGRRRRDLGDPERSVAAVVDRQLLVDERSDATSPKLPASAIAVTTLPVAGPTLKKNGSIETRHRRRVVDCRAASSSRSSRCAGT